MSQGKYQGKRRAPKKSRLPNKMALVAAPVVTSVAVGAGVVMADLGVTGTDAVASQDKAAAPNRARAATGSIAAAAAAPRTLGTSRSAERVALPSSLRKPVATARLWTTRDLDVRVGPGKRSATEGEIKSGERLAVTGRTQDAYSEVIVKGATRWVTTSYLSKAKPDPEPADMGLSNQACAGSSGTERGLTSDAVRVYRAVCNNFPQVSHYGGWDNHGEHTSGRAIDIMISDVKVGTQIAEFLRAHAAELDLYDVIWRQRIWTPVRSSEGWRSMSNRGSATANHYDHVHVSVN